MQMRVAYTAHALTERMETDAGACKICVREAVHVRRERKGASNSEEKKKNGKRNDPGKAQSINGCGADVKVRCLGQARPALMFWRAWSERSRI